MPFAADAASLGGDARVVMRIPGCVFPVGFVDRMPDGPKRIVGATGILSVGSERTGAGQH